MSIIESKEIEAAVRDVFEEGCAAWNRGDLDGYLASYWDSDRTLWISSGTLLRGRKAIAAAYKARFSTQQAMGKLTVAGLEIDVVTPTDAFAFGRWMLEQEERSSTGFFTVQLRKIDGGWFYVSDHASTSV